MNNSLKKLESQISSVEKELREVTRRLETGDDPGLHNGTYLEAGGRVAWMRVNMETSQK